MKWRKKADEEAVSPVIAIILMVAITVVLAGVLYVWVTSLADTDEGVTLLNISGDIEVDDGAQTVNITLTHNGGNPIKWGDYQMTVGGVTVLGDPVNPVTSQTAPTTNVGEAAMWTVDNSGGTYVIGVQYTIKVIVIKDSTIAWQKDITATAS